MFLSQQPHFLKKRKQKHEILLASYLLKITACTLSHQNMSAICDMTGKDPSPNPHEEVQEDGFRTTTILDP